MVRPKRCLFGTLIFLFVLIILLFIIIFVIIPVVFKYSIDVQRTIIFPTWIADASTNYSDTKKLEIRGVKNFYITVDEKDNVTLGAWHIIPGKLLNGGTNDNYPYNEILASDHDILIYLHGNGGVRSIPLELYDILRSYFQIIAVDYRGYADSTKAELNEDNIVSDLVNFYEWVKSRAKARIFIWGHSLGTGVATHTISRLKARNNTPSGLVLETPFTSIPDVMEYNFFVKVISWLPWYKSLTIQPVIDNGFGFNSSKYVGDVDCPIMILHAKDDTIVPYPLADQLYETIVTHRNFSYQGNVTYYLFDAVGYDHMYLYLAPQLPKYVQKFIKECVEFENQIVTKSVEFENGTISKSIF